MRMFRMNFFQIIIFLKITLSHSQYWTLQYWRGVLSSEKAEKLNFLKARDKGWKAFCNKFRDWLLNRRSRIMLFLLLEPSKDVLRMRHANLFEEQPLLDELLKLAGFSKLFSLRCFNIDPSLITALVERWRPYTHTFHLSCGECTIKLEDVSLQLEMNVNGMPVRRPTYFDWDKICGELLGKVRINEKRYEGCELKARILYIIGGKLLPEKSNIRVHLMYLYLLRDLSRVHIYSWGSACLAKLYREMCWATKPNAKAMGGFDGLPTYPFAKRWSQTQLNFQGVPRGDLTGYRSRLDHMEVSDFKWLPYETYNNNHPRQVQQDKKVWIQDSPQPPKNLDALHRVDKRGNQDANWATKLVQWIEYWSHRRDQVLRGPQIQYPIHTQQYMIWYRRNSKLFLSSETQL
ncbi:hypothetical protein Lal_00032025 [Lupinus albus]|nr:hypothetical protein Lal_00032025 [Lupinus albus]